MNKSTLALAVALGAIAQQAGAAGFIEDSKATLGLRNFYINTDNRDGAPDHHAQNKRRVGPRLRSAFHLGLHPGHCPVRC